MAHKEIKKYPILVIFFMILIIGMVVDIVYPDRLYSELQNKKLVQRPHLVWKNVVNNKWTREYNEYINEQFILSDKWIDLWSLSECILFQKLECDEILLGKQNMLFKKQYALKTSQERQLEKNINAVREFTKKYPGKVSFLLAPSASLIYKENVPAHAPMLDENHYLDTIFSSIEQHAAVIDMREKFLEEKNEYLYYRTDHHWTTKAAYLAYKNFCEKRGLQPQIYRSEIERKVGDFYGTSYLSSRKWNAVPDEISYMDLPNPMTLYKILGENQFEVEEKVGLYDKEKLKGQDKYGMFLHGNNGYSTIEGNGKGKLLVVKDSYANCLVPFLIEHYERIDVIDLRNYNYSLDSLIESEQYQDIFIVYNFQSFTSDMFLPNLVKPSALKQKP